VKRILMLTLLIGCGEARVETPVPMPAPESAEAAIPSGPAGGTIQGRDFAYEKASIEEGILKLRQGADFFADLEVMLFLFLEEEGVVPEGRSWDVDCAGAWVGGTPHVHVAARAEGERMPEHASVTCDYRLRLELGQETPDGMLPGTIHLVVPSLGTEVAGHFEAAIEGYRLKDGAVDLSQDDLDVAHHVAEVWLTERSGGAVEMIDNALGWLHTEKPEGRAQVGYSVYWWRS